MRGYRIELGEIASVLNQHPAVKESVAVLRQEKSALPQIVAYVVPESTADSNEIRRFAHEQLAQHMIPLSFVFIDAFPLTRNGKIDLRALPVPDTVRPDSVLNSYRREHQQKNWWRAFGLRCSTLKRSVFTTIFSSWAAIRCWQRE